MEARVLYGVLSAVLLASSAACGLPFGGTVGPAGDGGGAYRAGLDALDRGAFADAEAALRSAAACGSDGEAATAFLLLASLHQDPRYPEAHPDSAALMAARFLHLPDTRPEGRRLAETLYVLALDHGGDPGVRPEPGRALVDAGGGCRSDVSGGRSLPLPVLSETPYAFRLRRAEARADSLALRLDALARDRGATQGRVEELEAELARIRRLLQEPDTAAGGPPPAP